MQPVPISDLFPDSPRFVFGKAPLTFVVAQLRFPVLLRIQKEPPAEFQERIRSKFPLFEKPVAGSAINPAIGALPQELTQFLGSVASGVQYSFSTSDRLMSLTLSPDAISLTANHKGYTRWEDFFKTFHQPLEAFTSIYTPSFFTRVGLRYQDAISRKVLGLEHHPWSSLIRHDLLGEMAIPALEQSVESVANRTILLRLPDDSGQMLFRHGLGTTLHPNNQSEIVYVIDMDLSKQGTSGLNDAESRLNTYHELAGRIFRWAILDPLRLALEPHDPNE